MKHYLMGVFHAAVAGAVVTMSSGRPLHAVLVWLGLVALSFCVVAYFVTSANEPVTRNPEPETRA